MKQLPQKLSRQEYCSIKGRKIILFNEKTGKERTYTMPTWLVNEIEFKIEMGKNDAGMAALNRVKSALTRGY